MRKQELHPRTAVINKTQKNQSKHARMQALQWLADKFPEAFDNKLRIRPLKNGIMTDILAYAEEAEKAGISKSKLREAVVLFTRRIDYLTCLKAREMRVDLAGLPVDEVSVEEAERAAAKIKKRVEKSARNARKMMNARSPAPASNHYQSYAGGSAKPAAAKAGFNSFSDAKEDDFDYPQYPRNHYAYTGEATAKPKSPAVTVKHKAAKAYDPDAVARLKEKLGLSVKKAEKAE